MKPKLTKLMLAAAVLTMAAACGKDEVKKEYYVPSEVTLQDPVVNPSDLSVSLGAVYNGGDDGIAKAEFLVTDKAGGEPVSYTPDEIKDGRASVSIKNLKRDHDYAFNFVITTPGANKSTAAEDGYCSLHAPYDFVFSTQTTNTAKILTVSFKGSAAFAKSMDLKLVDPAGVQVADVPEIVVHDGEIKVMFKLADWPGELYDCSVDMTLADGTQASSQTEPFSTFPMPENLVQNPLSSTSEGVWTLTADYDGDDKTVLSAVVNIYDKDGTKVATLTPVCSGRQAVATTSGHDYGKYSWDCTLNLVDGSVLSAGPAQFTYAKPREFATLSAPYADLVTAGISTSDAEGPFNFTFSGYDWEVSFLRAKTDKGYLINGSSRKGYICNVTPFPKGIKAVHMDLTQSDRKLENYEFFAKEKATDEWTSVPGSQPVAKEFLLDLSDGSWNYFKFQSKGLKEVRFSGFSDEYFTEDPVEY
ncbi:MAG: hypothetical protein IJ799_04030 [Bacteroidales bacterium]|nr:hypothetical protein [Bacteroidales bacterium]